MVSASVNVIIKGKKLYETFSQNAGRNCRSHLDCRSRTLLVQILPRSRENPGCQPGRSGGNGLRDRDAGSQDAGGDQSAEHRSAGETLRRSGGHGQGGTASGGHVVGRHHAAAESRRGGDGGHPRGAGPDRLRDRFGQSESGICPRRLPAKRTSAEKPCGFAIELRQEPGGVSGGGRRAGTGEQEETGNGGQSHAASGPDRLLPEQTGGNPAVGPVRRTGRAAEPRTRFYCQSRRFHHGYDRHFRDLGFGLGG